MKKILMGAAAALAVAAPAHAASGYLGVSYSTADIDPGSLDSQFWGIDGSVAFEASSSLGIAVDAAFADSDDTDSTTAGTVHVFAKSDKHLIGAFAGIANTNDNNVWDAGAEAQFFTDTATLGIAVAYASADDADVDGFGVNGAVKFFPADNFTIGGNIGWFQLDSGGADADAWIGGLAAEYQMESVPVSLLAGYSHFDGNDSGLAADVFTLGARYNFGGGTLKDRNRSGADLAGLSGVSALRF